MPPREVADAVAALNRGDSAAARALCDAAVKAGRGDADIWHILGILSAREGRLEDAVKAFAVSIDLQPDHSGSLANLALLHRRAGRPDLAVPLYRRTVEIEPGNAAVWRGLAGALLALGDARQARAAADTALGIAPDDPVARRLSLNATIQDEDVSVPLAEIENLVQEAPHAAANHFLASLAYSRLAREADAREALRRCLALDPRHHQAMNNLARLHFEAGEYGAARRLYETAISVRPDYAEARFQLGQLLLLLGEYERGWSEYAWRHRSANYRRFGNRATSDLPLWDGSPLAGRRLIVHAEQGLGDTIQFLRYLPAIESDGGTILCFVQEALADTLRSFDSGAVDIRFIERAGAAPIEAELQAPLMSLAAPFWSHRGAAGDRVPYLAADPVRVEDWRRWWAERGRGRGRKRIGLVWAGNPHHRNDRNRSIPAEALGPLLGLPDIDWVSLQVGPAAAGTRNAPMQGRITDISSRLTDFADTAAAMTTLDLTISVDTAPAHLAGAHGLPVWTLLPHVPDWRWGLESTETQWYPSMRLFRQEAPVNWAPVLDKVASALREHMGRS